VLFLCAPLQIPEVSFPLDGPHGVLALTEAILARQGYGVIVVAEGAGVDLLPTIGKDESGNKKLPEVGKFLQSAIQDHFARKKQDVSIKYHDPSYMIRSVPADASDSVYCMTLAQNAVHGAMCGSEWDCVG
jgi:6-phosphofructokinase 1